MRDICICEFATDLEFQKLGDPAFLGAIIPACSPVPQEHMFPGEPTPWGSHERCDQGNANNGSCCRSASCKFESAFLRERHRTCSLRQEHIQDMSNCRRQFYLSQTKDGRRPYPKFFINPRSISRGNGNDSWAYTMPCFK